MHSLRKFSKRSFLLFNSSKAVTLKKDFPGTDGQFGYNLFNIVCKSLNSLYLFKSTHFDFEKLLITSTL